MAPGGSQGCVGQQGGGSGLAYFGVLVGTVPALGYGDGPMAAICTSAPCGWGSWGGPCHGEDKLRPGLPPAGLILEARRATLNVQRDPAVR